MITASEGLKGLNRFLGNVSEDKRHLIELGGFQWSGYDRSGSSHDGRYVAFSHYYKALTEYGEQLKSSLKWLTHSSKSENGGVKQITFDEKDLPDRRLSRDGQTPCSSGFGMMNPITRVYRAREEAGKDPVAFMKFELYGKLMLSAAKAIASLLWKGQNSLKSTALAKTQASWFVK